MTAQNVHPGDQQISSFSPPQGTDSRHRDKKIPRLLRKKMMVSIGSKAGNIKASSHKRCMIKDTYYKQGTTRTCSIAEITEGP